MSAEMASKVMQTKIHRSFIGVLDGSRKQHGHFANRARDNTRAIVLDEDAVSKSRGTSCRDCACGLEGLIGRGIALNGSAQRSLSFILRTQRKVDFPLRVQRSLSFTLRVQRWVGCGLAGLLSNQTEQVGLGSSTHSSLLLEGALGEKGSTDRASWVCRSIPPLAKFVLLPDRLRTVPFLDINFSKDGHQGQARRTVIMKRNRQFQLIEW